MFVTSVYNFVCAKYRTYDTCILEWRSSCLAINKNWKSLVLD